MPDEPLPIEDPNAAPAAPKSSFRGPLRYEVETSSSQIQAGTKCSVFIKITNPYEVPVDIVSTETMVPVEFYNSKEQPKSIKDTLWSMVKQETLDKLEADRTDAQVLRGVPVQPNIDAVSATHGNKVPGAVRLQPGNATLYEFQLRTRRTLFFTPAVYNLHMQVQYRMDGLLNHDTAKYQLNVSAPLKAMIWGAVLGAIIGSLLRDLYRTKTATDPWFSSDLPLTAISGVLVGAVLVIAFARKKDAQPFISIEDFYGGFFVGFVAGYVGKPLLDELLPDKTGG